MIVFLISIIILTALISAFYVLLVRKITTNYRGGMMIVLSCVYFTLFFYIAHLMRDSFK